MCASKLKNTGNAKKAYKKRPLNPKARKIVIPCRVNPEEMRHILAMAAKFTRGNVSEYIRARLASHIKKLTD